MHRSTTVVAVAHVVIAGCAFASTARATAFHWAAPSSGRLCVAASWAENGVPGAGDNAIVDATGAPYSVDLCGTGTLGGLVVASSDATVLVQGSDVNNQTTITVTNGVDVQAGELRLESANQAFISRLN